MRDTVDVLVGVGKVEGETTDGVEEIEMEGQKEGGEEGERDGVGEADKELCVMVAKGDADAVN